MRAAARRVVQRDAELDGAALAEPGVIGIITGTAVGLGLLVHHASGLCCASTGGGRRPGGSVTSESAWHSVPIFAPDWQ